VPWRTKLRSAQLGTSGNPMRRPYNGYRRHHVSSCLALSTRVLQCQVSKNTIAFLHDTMRSAINLPTFRGNALPPSSKQKRMAERSSKIMEISARLHGVTFQTQYCICKTTECNTRKAGPWGTFVSAHNLDAKSTMELKIN